MNDVSKRFNFDTEIHYYDSNRLGPSIIVEDGEINYNEESDRSSFIMITSDGDIIRGTWGSEDLSWAKHDMTDLNNVN